MVGGDPKTLKNQEDSGKFSCAPGYVGISGLASSGNPTIIILFFWKKMQPEIQISSQ